MSFLDNFQVTINHGRAHEPLTLTPAETLYGGRPEDWWRRKFRFYRRQIEALEEVLGKKPSAKLTRSLRYLQTSEPLNTRPHSPRCRGSGATDQRRCRL